jgi:hypothetical protein
MATPRIKRRKPASARREAVIKVLVTSDEMATLQGAADVAGLSLSTWLRFIAMQTAGAQKG